MGNAKQDRVLEIFFRSLHGEDLSVHKLADEYKVSTKSVTRCINDIKAFFADHRELVGNTELKYSYNDKCYHLYMDEFLSNKELFSILEILIGSRAFSKPELISLIEKLRSFTTLKDREVLNRIIRKELYHYGETETGFNDIQETLWNLANYVADKHEIAIEYVKSGENTAVFRIRPVSIMFNEHYFYLIAFKSDSDNTRPYYFRIDRINKIIERRKKFSFSSEDNFNESILRKRSIFLRSGKLNKIVFEYCGPVIQDVMEKIPSSKIIKHDDGKYIVEAEVYGDGIKQWILSQGKWARVLKPDDFVLEMQSEINDMHDMYL